MIGIFSWIFVIGGLISGAIILVPVGILGMILFNVLQTKSHYLTLTLSSREKVEFHMEPEYFENEPLLREVVNFITHKGDINYDHFNNLRRNYLTFLLEYPKFDRGILQDTIDFYQKLK